MNIIFVKRGHAYLENYTEDSKKERKKKRLMEESSICTALHGLYIKQFYIQFHPFYITKRINNTINGIFCHRLQYGKGTYGTIAYIIVIGKQCNLYLLYNDTLYFQLLKLHVHPQYKQTSTCSSFSLS